MQLLFGEIQGQSPISLTAKVLLKQDLEKNEDDAAIYRTSSQ